MPDAVIQLITLFGILAVVLTVGGLLIWLERRLLALWQDRYGPNRVGPFGILQVVADMIKVFTKEDWIPPFADKAVFIIAPAVIVVVVLMSYTVIPFAPGIQVVDLNIGLLFFLACRRSACTASLSRDGLRRANTPCSAGCELRPRCSPMKYSWVCRSWAW
jgi:NADH-quinone oxidoreductase subunit H